MDLKLLERRSEYEWVFPPTGKMRVPVVIYASENLLEAMDDNVLVQARNVAALPGVQRAVYAMPDAHWGYGFPIGGVAAFDPEEGGIVSGGGVGFDIACGVRTMLTGLPVQEVLKRQKELADALYRWVPAGVGSTGDIHLSLCELDEMMIGGAQWAVKRGYGFPEDLERIEEHGKMEGADPSCVSSQAKKRQQDEMGTLGSGNHYLEVQEIVDIYDEDIARVYGLRKGEVVVMIHCGSRGLGHQINTDYLKEMAVAAQKHGIPLPERELACAPILSDVGQRYLGAMRAGINCALANRQIIGHLTRQAFAEVFSDVKLTLLYDVSHNTCRVERHQIDGRTKLLYVHRKGATRSFGPCRSDELPPVFKEVGQPVLIGGSMGTCSYILAGTDSSEKAFASAVHGAGRAMSRNQAVKQWNGREVIDDLGRRGIIVRSPSPRGVAEEAPGAYKNVSEVVEAAVNAGLAKKVARCKPLICIKG